jgi:hypothetical protein
MNMQAKNCVPSINDLLDVFFGFVMIPIMVLGIELRRYFYARAEIVEAVDAASLVAAAEITQQVSENSGDLTATSRPGLMPRPLPARITTIWRSTESVQ